MKQLYSKQNLSKQRGIFVPLFLLIMFALIAVLGLAVDLANYYRAQVRLQRAVDAAALAAARRQLQPIPVGTPMADVQNDIASSTAVVLSENLIQSGFSGEIQSQNIQVTMQAQQTPAAGNPATRSYTTVQASVKPKLMVMDMVPFISDSTIISASAEAEARSAIISLIVDVSGSMNHSLDDPSVKKIDALKDAVKNFVDQLYNTRDVVALSKFSSSASIVKAPNGYWDSPQQIQQHRDDLKREVDLLSADGRTNASEALFTGFRAVRDAVQSLPLPCYIIFFTDGAPNISTVNWVPSSAGDFSTNSASQNPDPLPLPTDWHAYKFNNVADNHWYRSYGGYRTDDTRLEDFCPGPSPCAGTDGVLLKAALGLSHPISFRVPGEYASDDHTGRLYNLFALTDPNDDQDKVRKIHYLTGMAMSDFVRTAVPGNSCTVFAIGLGRREANFDEFYTTLRDDSLPRKDYFLSRVANDPNCGGTTFIPTCRDEPDHYVDTYDELRNKRAPQGKYYPTERVSDLNGKFQDVLANIRLRLNR